MKFRQHYIPSCEIWRNVIRYIYICVYIYIPLKFSYLSAKPCSVISEKLGTSVFQCQILCNVCIGWRVNLERRCFSNLAADMVSESNWILLYCNIMQKLTSAIINLEGWTNWRKSMFVWVGGGICPSDVAGGRQEDAPYLPGVSVWYCMMVRTLHAIAWPCTVCEICPFQAFCGRGFLFIPRNAITAGHFIPRCTK
jgi:hypothetical protein